MTQVGVFLFAITAALSPQMGYMMSLKRHPQGAVAGFYTFPSKNADKCLTGTKEYLEQVLAKLQAPNSSLRYVWYNSTVQEGFCPDRFMQHDRSGDLCFPDVEVWIDNDASPILNTNHVRMGSLYKIRHHDFAFPDVKINHPVVMVECLNGTTVGVESAVATSAVDADAKAVSLLATSKEEQDPNRPAWVIAEEPKVRLNVGPKYSHTFVKVLREAVHKNPQLTKADMDAAPKGLPAWEQHLEQLLDTKFGESAYVMKDFVRTQIREKGVHSPLELDEAIIAGYPAMTEPGVAQDLQAALVRS
jgi:hypothetical protein